MRTQTDQLQRSGVTVLERFEATIMALPTTKFFSFEKRVGSFHKQTFQMHCLEDAKLGVCQQSQPIKKKKCLADKVQWEIAYVWYEQLKFMLKYVQNIHCKTYFNGIDAKFFLQLRTLFHNRCGEFQNRILVGPGVSTTSFVNFSLVQHLLSIDVNQMIGELSVFWGRISFCIANGFICSTCFRKK